MTIIDVNGKDENEKCRARKRTEKINSKLQQKFHFASKNGYKLIHHSLDVNIATTKLMLKMISQIETLPQFVYFL